MNVVSQVKELHKGNKVLFEHYREEICFIIFRDNRIPMVISRIMWISRILCNRSWETFSLNGQIINILGM